MKLWVPGATVIPATRDAGTMVGGAAKVVWHTTENDPKITTAKNIALYLNRVNSQVHLIWNPETGEMIQMIPANRGGRGLANAAGGVETNRGGSIVFQIEVVGRAKEPWTNGPMKGLPVILDFLNQLGIPQVWPAGDLKPYPESYGGYRSTSAWAKGGHFGHAQVPENTHGDPGDIDQSKTLTGVLAPVPAPAPVVPAPAPKPTVVILKVGSIGPAVARVQKIVGAVADGIFGPNTRLKVIAWQKAKGIPADGIWGPQCEAAYAKSPAPAPAPKPANPVTGAFPLPRGHFYGVNDGTNWSHSGLRGGADKTNVIKIQKKVGAGADGIFGPATRLKVIAWQKKYRLTADGLVGAGTWAAMLKN